MGNKLMNKDAHTTLISELASYRDVLVKAGLSTVRIDGIELLAQQVADETDSLKKSLEWVNDTPSTECFITAVQNEIDHQRKRWGKDHDHNKHLFEWMALANRLLGKMVDAQWNGDIEKVLHHVITLAAVMGNCHASIISIPDRKN